MSTVARSNYVASGKAQQTRVVAGRDRIGASDTQVELARAGDVEAATFSKTDISIKSTGRTVFIKGSYASTNHYIRQSRGYVKKDGKLRQFINFPFMGYLFGFFSFAAIFSFLHYFYGAIVFVLSLLFFLLFCQHLHVLRGTLPYVLKQPVIKEQEHDNAFYEIELSKLQGAYLQAKDEGVGVIIQAKGKIKLQVFNYRAITHMSNCRIRSVIMFLCTIIQLMWSFGWIIANLAQGGVVIKTGSSN